MQGNNVKPGIVYFGYELRMQGHKVKLGTVDFGHE
jgi:hypothetical protein